VIVRRALAGSLPEEVRWRGGKGNLGHNLNRNLPAFEQDLLEETISKDSGAIEEYVDVATLRKAYDRYVSQNDLSDAVKVFTATNLALWLRWAGIRS